MKALLFALLGTTLVANTVFADQICRDSINRSTPDGRFSIQGVGTLVFDRVTERSWMRCPLGYTFSDNDTLEQYADDRCIEEPESAFTWQDALLATANHNQSAANEFRIPNIKELSSLVESSCAWPAINSYVFPDTEAAAFWSSTPNGIASARSVSFDTGRVDSSVRDVLNRVRLIAEVLAR